MKKMFFLFILLLNIMSIRNVKADNDYLSFQEITKLNNGKFLSDFTKKEYDKYYKKVSKRKFWDWSVYIVNKEIKVKYITQTHFSFYNNGTTPITYESTFKEEKNTKRSLSASGSIDISSSGNIKKFKSGLDAELKLDYTSSSTRIITQAWSVKVSIDPGTLLLIYTQGEGKITNGVAARYRFWIRKSKGGFEVFVATSQNYRMEKVKI